MSPPLEFPSMTAEAIASMLLPLNTTIINPFDGYGLNPQVLVGKHVISFSYCRNNSCLTMEFTDGTQLVVTHRQARQFKGEESETDEPEMYPDTELAEALKVRHALRPPLTIVAAVAGKRTSDDILHLSPEEIGMPVPTVHRVLGLRLDGMNAMGWMEAKVIHGDRDCPDRVEWTDVVVAKSRETCLKPGHCGL